MINDKGELMCCVACGRDTSAKDGLCNRCRAGAYGKMNHMEMIGRKQRKIKESDSPLQLVEEDPVETTSQEDYHGDTIRDDL